MFFSKLFPELDRFETREEGRRAFSTAVTKVTTSGRYWAIIAGIVAVSVWLQFSLRRFGISGGWRTAVSWLIVVLTVAACWSLFLIFKKTIRRQLRQSLVERGIPCCIGCGYDLQGNESGVCPECGTEVEQP